MIKLSKKVNNKGADQTALMRKLVCTFVICMKVSSPRDPFVGLKVFRGNNGTYQNRDFSFLIKLVLFSEKTDVPHHIQWQSQNAEKVTHIKGRLLYQAMILYSYIPFQNGNFS